MSEANNRQVGGEHYRTEVQHWDWAIAVRLPYLEAASTKYVARHRKKAGLLDLEKAGHYLEKCREGILGKGMKDAPRPNSNRQDIAYETSRFALANKLTALEHSFMFLMAAWCVVEELDLAELILKDLITEATEATEVVTEPGLSPVPLTEENHYAERAPNPFRDKEIN